VDLPIRTGVVTLARRVVSDSDGARQQRAGARQRYDILFIQWHQQRRQRTLLLSLFASITRLSLPDFAGLLLRSLLLCRPVYLYPATHHFLAFAFLPATHCWVATGHTTSHRLPLWTWHLSLFCLCCILPCLLCPYCIGLYLQSLHIMVAFCCLPYCHFSHLAPAGSISCLMASHHLPSAPATTFLPTFSYHLRAAMSILPHHLPRPVLDTPPCLLLILYGLPPCILPGLPLPPLTHCLPPPPSHHARAAHAPHLAHCWRAPVFGGRTMEGGRGWSGHAPHPPGAPPPHTLHPSPRRLPMPACSTHCEAAKPAVRCLTLATVDDATNDIRCTLIQPGGRRLLLSNTPGRDGTTRGVDVIFSLGEGHPAVSSP